MKKSTPVLPGKTQRRNFRSKSVQDLQPGPFPIVGIGASAGGIKAISELLKHLNPGLGMAYVFIMHLSPGHKSALAEVIQSKTRMKVQTARNGMKIMKDNIFVIPPKTSMSMVDGHLQLVPMSLNVIGNFSIDYFLTGLASIYKNNAIGVILSGTGTDGTLGLKAIKAEGGITFSQDATAEFDGMPGHAHESGYVDFKLSPKNIADELRKFARVPYLIQHSDKIEHVQQTEIEEHAEELQKILGVVRNEKGMDFYRDYKHASIYRRVMRRMALNKFANLHDYRVMVETDPKEVKDLYDDFLINVTDFFRDPDFYSTLLNRVFPSVIKQKKPDDPLRIWIAGCSTGEEAYSVAIYLTEFLKKRKLVIPFSIFASDLDSIAIEKARLGIYAISALRKVLPEYIAKYFLRRDNHYEIVKSIRQLCVFSQHNLIKDPPFPRIDLISCQNVLIYLDIIQQERVLRTFHYALRPGRFLFLGKSETVGNATNLFEALDKRIKVYTRQATKTPQLDFSVEKTYGNEQKSITIAGHVELNTEKLLTKLILSQFVYPCIVVNKDFMIVQFFGATAPYLGPTVGKASLNILKIIREELVIDVGRLLHEAKSKRTTASKAGIRIIDKKKIDHITLEIIPKTITGEILFLIVFKVHEEVESRKGKLPKLKGKPDARTIQRLEQELSESRGLVRSTNEEYETTYEELQANNEEILSSNEELQSINEELEASKEELQSAVDKLVTTNVELNTRNQDLDRSQKELKKVNSQLEEFAFISSHDLQEPLRKIRLYSERLLNGQSGLNTHGVRSAEKLNASAVRMSMLLRDLAGFSLLGVNDKLWERVGLNEVVSAVIDDFEVAIEEKKAVLTISKLPDIIGEPVRINRLFHNLLDNALKFSSSEPQISISSHEITPDVYLKYPELNSQQNYNVIKVSDNGIGFDETYSEKIFTLFQRLGAADVRGTGAGLAICRKIVEDHGGFIYGHGKKGVGAVFLIFFPIR